MSDGAGVQLGAVEQTLMIPLYGRAVETRKRRPLLSDPRAVQIVESLDYDFTRMKASASGATGAVLRTVMFDVWVRRFLAEHPDGTVVEIGTGLNTRFDRLDNGRVTWFDLDLPNVIALRRRFFDDTDRRQMLPASVLDQAWVPTVQTGPGPYLFVAEAVLLYFEPHQVEDALHLIGANFPGALLAAETGGRAMADSVNRNDVLRSMGARMTWMCEDPAEVECLGVRLLESRTFLEPPPELRARMPLRLRALSLVMGAVFRRRVRSYRLNLFRFVEDVTEPRPESASR
ncbi:class I SAM-dependent methyltransferase [Micromonospora sp. WMMD1082]|uniref:class I SAM-dependent methyltransferase n=1 Tax=Micromonospora sp. WMMD1082 TaxID=3016104 RepID=UPI002416DC11|nr:class I SAM-dependent methyltransferase [Micromonospora sp. WMMD1082]MDG4795584.1 class I SAM-dependent methyltransferase [Micromonospora sp. WMMD1082]